MLLGALVDAGLPPQKLKKGLSYLPIKGYKLNIRKVKRAGFMATKVDVVINPSKSPLSKGGLKGGRHSEVKKWKDIEKIIKASALSKDIKQKGLYIFKRLFEAEAKVHGEKVENIHLHELGAVDSLIDVFGTLIGLDVLGIKKVYSSPLNLGSGIIKTEHGTLPVPAPATAELLKNVSVYSSDIDFELTTPTGAILISSLADGFGTMPDIAIFKIGIGAGSKDFKKQPNVLRVFVGTPPFNSPLNKGGQRGVTVIETNIDDMNPQIYEYVMEKLFESGALDVFLTQVIMKKGRPGVKLTVLCNDDKGGELIKTILKETTSIGVRFYQTQRKTLQRTIESVDTKFGKVKVKVSRLGTDIVKITPEYEDCKKTAKKFRVPLIEVIKSVSSIER